MTAAFGIAFTFGCFLIFSWNLASKLQCRAEWCGLACSGHDEPIWISLCLRSVP